MRVWVSGCSTGEEAYSIAIALLEFLSGQAMEPPIQIFGTDASESSIARARAGLYSESITDEVSPERLRRFFTRVDQGYQVNKRVRDLCIFARQNLCTDPPFSRLDLVSCRNVLIYLGSAVQNSILTTFHYALKPRGVLLLGNSESLRAQSELFQPCDRKHRFYTKVPNTRWVPVETVPTLRHPAEQNLPAVSPTSREGWSEYELQRAADRIVLARYGPAGAVVTDKFDVLQIRGNTSPYLQIPAGAPSLNLLRMARDELAPVLRDAVRRCIEEDIPVRVDEVHVRNAEEIHLLSLEVLPVQGVPARPRCYMVLFIPKPGQPIPERRSEDQSQAAPGVDSEIRRLEQDLSSTRMYLQSLVEERDARNQELTSAYEEVQSANEELQSTNEELETAKEELQSTNEELQTVNDELRNRNSEMLRASSDLQNILTSVNIPVVMLDSQLTIRHYTPPTERLMHVRPADIGRHIGEIRLNINLHEIEPLLNDVLDSLATRELEVQDRQGRWHLLRVRPYRTLENKIDGLVLVLLDIEQLRRSEQAMREAADFARAVLEGAQAALVVTDEKLRIRTANAAFRNLSGQTQAELEGRTLPDLVEHLWDMQSLRSPLGTLATTEGPESLELYHEFGGDEGRSFRLSARRVAAEGNCALLVMIEDQTLHRRAERALQKDRERLKVEVGNATAELTRMQEELRALNARLFLSQEEERRRLARDLHDDIGQRLAAVQMLAESLLAGEMAAAQPRLAQLTERIEEISADLRNLSHQLHPSVLDDLGLAAALRQLVDEFGEQQQVLATFTARSIIPPIPAIVAGGLYRIAQEALRNVAKHAGKTHLRVLLAYEEEKLKLHVRDLGGGFDLEQGTRPGLGLLSMAERARLIGGEIRISSELGAGTTVEVEVPIAAASQKQAT